MSNSMALPDYQQFCSEWDSNDPNGEASAQSQSPFAIPSPYIQYPLSLSEIYDLDELFGPQSNSHGKKKADGHIRRPPNCFLVFRSRVYKSIKFGHGLHPVLEAKGHRVFQEMKEVNGHQVKDGPWIYRAPTGLEKKVGAMDVSEFVGEAWRSLTDEEKLPFKAEAAELRRLHKLKFPDFVYRASTLASTLPNITTFVDEKPSGKANSKASKTPKASAPKKQRSIVVKKKPAAKKAAVKSMVRNRESRYIDAVQELRAPAIPAPELVSARVVPPVRAPSCPPPNTIPSISRSRRAPTLQRAETMPSLSYSQGWEPLEGAMGFQNQVFSFAPQQNVTGVLAESIAPHELPSHFAATTNPTFTAFAQSSDTSYLGHAVLQDPLVLANDIVAPTPSYYTSPIDEMFQSTPLDNINLDLLPAGHSGAAPERYSPTIPLNDYARGIEAFNNVNQFEYPLNDNFNYTQDQNGQFFDNTLLSDQPQTSFYPADETWYQHQVISFSASS